jgi:hypothetical protein
MARRLSKTRRRHSRKGSRKQRGGVETTTVGNLLQVLRELNYDVEEFKYELFMDGHYDYLFLRDDDDNYIYDNDLIPRVPAMDETAIMTEPQVMRALRYNLFYSNAENERQAYPEIHRRLFESKQRGRNITALRNVAKNPNNRTRATNVLFHPQLSGEIGSYLSGKTGSVVSQVNKLKQNMGISMAPRP